MIKMKNELGTISISQNAIVRLVSAAATESFGVAEMASRNKAEELASLIRLNREGKGIRVRATPDGLCIDLHIVVVFGVNIPAISESIVHRISYGIQNTTGIAVRDVNIFVDAIKAE